MLYDSCVRIALDYKRCDRALLYARDRNTREQAGAELESKAILLARTKAEGLRGAAEQVWATARWLAGSTRPETIRHMFFIGASLKKGERTDWDICYLRGVIAG